MHLGLARRQVDAGSNRGRVDGADDGAARAASYGSTAFAAHRAGGAGPRGHPAPNGGHRCGRQHRRRRHPVGGARRAKRVAGPGRTDRRLLGRRRRRRNCSESAFERNPIRGEAAGSDLGQVQPDEHANRGHGQRTGHRSSRPRPHLRPWHARAAPTGGRAGAGLVVGQAARAGARRSRDPQEPARARRDVHRDLAAAAAPPEPDVPIGACNPRRSRRAPAARILVQPPPGVRAPPDARHERRSDPGGGRR